MLQNESSRPTVWKKERVGLIMIIASIVVIAVVAFVAMQAQVETRRDQIRNQGIGLVRVLGNMQWSDVLPSNPGQGVLQTLQYAQHNTDFAYAMIVDNRGRAQAEVAAEGVLIPPPAIATEPAAWIGERTVGDASGSPRFIEFHAPLFADNELMGHIRLGYSIPGFSLTTAVISEIAKFGLPVFLLTALFYALMRAELRPLKKVSRNLEEMVSTGALPKLELQPSDELGAFMDRFMAVVEASQQRITQLSAERDGMLTETKLVAYRQSKTEAILKMLPDAVLVLDESGCVSYANQRVHSLLGIDDREVIGTKAATLCADPELAAFLDRQGAGGNRVGFISNSVVFKPTANPQMSVEARAIPLFVGHDREKRLGDVVVLRDITDAQLAKSGRSEFVAQMAHELKTPLNVLSMYSESLLGEDGNDEEFRTEGLNVIHDQVERLASFINGMLTLSQFELGSMTLQRTRVRLTDLLQDAFSDVSHSGHDRGIGFEIDIPREITPLNIDKDLLRIALNNLLTNAIKYNKPGGKVVLSASESADEVTITVRDTGQGINADDLPHIFEPFFRSDDDDIREQNGHGLGLPLAKQIVELHHGRMELDSEPGVGSSFSIVLNKDVATLVMAGSA